MSTRAGSFVLKLITIITFSSILYLSLAAPVSPRTPVSHVTVYQPTHISRVTHDHTLPRPLHRSPLLRVRTERAGKMQHIQRRNLFNKIKHQFAKVTKFGLAVASAGAAVLGKATKFIPGAGTAVGSALKAISTGANIASNAIHVTLSAALQKGMGILSTIRDPLSKVGGVAGKALGAIFRREE